MLKAIRVLGLAAVVWLAADPTASAATSYYLAVDKWGVWDQVDRLYPGNQFFFVMKNQYWSLSAECDGGRQWYLDRNDANYDVKVRTLTTAFLAGREVKLHRSRRDRPDDCRAHVDRFQVR